MVLSCNSLNKAFDALKINQIQVIGSHNSYKRPIQAELMSYLISVDSTLRSLDYSHIGLTDQLDRGLRMLELDIYHDPEGGKFSTPLGNKLLENQGVMPLPYDLSNELSIPGFKVMHIQDIDFRSHCLLLTSCLKEMISWSEAHSGHLPIVISINAKTDTIGREGEATPLPFTSEVFDLLDSLLYAYFGSDKLISPDMVRGKYNTLEEAVLSGNWPLLSQARGKFLFVLDENEEKRNEYTRDHPSLKGRAMFVNAPPGNPEAAFIIDNNPTTNREKIIDLVKKGYLVRTRADAETIEARSGDYSRFEAAKSSGAQFISTDYYIVDERFGTGYKVQFDDGSMARLNPVLIDTALNTIPLEKLEVSTQ